MSVPQHLDGLRGQPDADLGPVDRRHLDDGPDAVVVEPEGKQEEQDRFKNPFELGPALTFGLIYAVILLAANAARLYLGDTGIYLSSIASGLADVDAITLTMAELSREGGGVELQTAARAIVLAAVAISLVKGATVPAMGAAALRRVILPGLLATLATAVGVSFTL